MAELSPPAPGEVTGVSSPSGSRSFAVRWIAVVAALWLIFAAERFLGYRIAGYGPPVLVLHGVGWATASAVTLFCVVTSWRQSHRSLAAAAAVLGLLSAGAISLVDWRTMHAREFYREHRHDFATLADQARQGLHNGDEAGGSQLSDDLEYLSDNGLVGSVNTPEKPVLFVPALAARGDIHRNGAGAVHGCAIGYLNTDVDMFPSVDDYPACSGRTPLGDGWYWVD